MIDLRKVEAKQPDLVEVATTAADVLRAKGLGDHEADVLLVLDLSPSTHDYGLYADGQMQTVANQAFVTGLHLDADGKIPLAFFGSKLVERGNMTLDNYNGYVDRERRGLDLWGTQYAPVIKYVRSKASGGGFLRKNKGKKPIYAVIVTDGQCSDAYEAEQELVAASNEGAFFQWIGIGPAQFPFLEKMDSLPGRVVDNAGFFAIEDPRRVTDAWMLDKMLKEYPEWLNAARARRIIA